EKVVEPLIEPSLPIRDRIRERIAKVRAASSASLARARRDRSPAS
ncbi:MAG: hypothetical protein QOK08_1481, partial [Actinomycetota bacterium]|nr:hypothetical protein [Actinomycetota bacterium]